MLSPTHRDYDNRSVLWIATCHTDSVNMDDMTITLEVGGITELQTTLIHPTMPNWILQPGTRFRCRIPNWCISNQTLLTVEWGGFESISAYSWTDDDEIFDLLEQTFDEGNNSDDRPVE